MDENGAAATAYPGPVVVPDDDDQVVEVIGPPKALGACAIGMSNVAVVVAILRSVAPPVIHSQRPEWQARARSSQAVCAKEGLPHRKTANGRRTVTLMLQGPPSRASECAGEAQASTRQNPALSPARKASHHELRRVLWMIRAGLHWSLPAPVLMASPDKPDRRARRAHSEDLSSYLHRSEPA
jgi:hypothetical protein